MTLHVVDDQGREYWTSSQAAEALGVARGTFTAYVSRGQAPSAAAYLDRLALWLVDDVRRWDRSRRSRRG